jgi:hypothetical protein
MRIYLSYRPGDSLGWEKVLSDELKKRLGERNVVESNSVGTSAPSEQIIGQVSRCNALLAIIGPNWLQGQGSDINDPKDPMHQEISAAVGAGLRLLAICVGGAKMPDAKDLPNEIRRLAKSQAPELTSLNQRNVIEELLSGLDPDASRRRRRRIIDISLGGLVGALFVVAGVSLWLPSKPTPDDLWLNAIFPIEFGAPTRRYFNRDYNTMLPSPTYTGDQRDARWDSRDAINFLDPWWRDFTCVGKRDQVTFIFSENKLVRVSFRFCDGSDPCHSRRFLFFAALARKEPTVDGNEEHFEAEGRSVDMRGWSGPGLTVVDLVKKGDPYFEGEPWFSFLRNTVLENQCRK